MGSGESIRFKWVAPDALALRRSAVCQVTKRVINACVCVCLFIFNTFFFLFKFPFSCFFFHFLLPSSLGDSRDVHFSKYKRRVAIPSSNVGNAITIYINTRNSLQQSQKQLRRIQEEINVKMLIYLILHVLYLKKKIRMKKR